MTKLAGVAIGLLLLLALITSAATFGFLHTIQFVAIAAAAVIFSTFFVVASSREGH